jgi:biotin carboxyl carrier protein
MKYHVTIAGRTVEVELGEELRIDGRPVTAEMASVPGTDTRSVVVEGRAHTLGVRKGARRGEWHLSLQGRALEAEVVDERTRAIREMTGAGAVETESAVRAPMPGLVLRVEVETGQAVKKGQGLVVVEAMKMENELKAPADGVVGRIQVAAGQAVEKGMVLLLLEPER